MPRQTFDGSGHDATQSGPAARDRPVLGRGDRRGSLGADRGVPAVPHPRRHAVRGRDTPRWPCAHPRRRRRRRTDACRRQRLHRAQRRHLSLAAQALRRAPRGGPAHRDEHERALRRLRPRVRRRPWPAGSARTAAPRCSTWTSSACSCRCKRFHRRASKFLRTTDDEDETTYGDFLRREGFGEHFIAHYAVPVVSCVWSAGGGRAGVPGALSLPLPRAPRDAPGRRLPAVVHRRRGLTHLCRAAERAASRRPRRSCRHRRHPAQPTASRCAT